jgi:hypothetical protein
MDDGEAIDIAQHPVEDDDVEIFHPRAQQSAGTGGFPCHTIAVCGEKLLYFGRRASVIFDIQDR